MNTTKIAAEATRSPPHSHPLLHLPRPVFSPFSQQQQRPADFPRVTLTTPIASTSNHHHNSMITHDASRIEHTIHKIPAGPLYLVIQSGESASQDHVYVKSVQDKSPLAGIVAVGDWIIEINGIPVVGESVPYCADLLRDAAQTDVRSLKVARSIPCGSDELEQEQEPAETFHVTETYTSANTSRSRSSGWNGKENNDPETKIKTSDKEQQQQQQQQQDSIVSLSFMSPLTKKKKPYAATPIVTLPASAAAASAVKELEHILLTTSSVDIDVDDDTETDNDDPSLAQYKLFQMTVPELRDEIRRRGWPGDDSVDRDAMLEDLGVPVYLWKSHCHLTVKQIKDQLRAKILKVSGSKSALLQRLGVPLWFLDSIPLKVSEDVDHNKCSSNNSICSLSPNAKKRSRDHPQEDATILWSPWSKKRKTLTPHLDPTHTDYELSCCDEPRFDCFDTVPAGGIWYSDGSMADVWRCLACGQIPHRPNAPPVEEYRDDEAAGIVGLLAPHHDARDDEESSNDDDDDREDTNDDNDTNNSDNDNKYKFQYYDVPSNWEQHIHHYTSDNGECVVM